MEGMGAEGGAGDVATEALEAVSVPLADGGAAVQGEAVAGRAARGQRVLPPAMGLHPPTLRRPRLVRPASEAAWTRASAS
jgi:hypothetical protein